MKAPRVFGCILLACLACAQAPGASTGWRAGAERRILIRSSFGALATNG